MIKIHLERWKHYPEDKRYKVSSDGRIKFKGKLVNYYIDHGYVKIVYNNMLVPVHQIVARTFLEKKIGDHLTVDHKDSNTRNNAVRNLELVSREENLERANNRLIKRDRIGLIECDGMPKEELEAMNKSILEHYKASGRVQYDAKLSKAYLEVCQYITDELVKIFGNEDIKLFAMKVGYIDSERLPKDFTVSIKELANYLITTRISSFRSDGPVKKMSKRIATRLSRAIMTQTDYLGYIWKEVK